MIETNTYIMGSKEENRWKKSDISYKNYQDYIGKKVDKYELKLVDLLYVSNFKGGNATINEKETEINKKLIHYTKGLKAIDIEFQGRKLSELTSSEIEDLVLLVHKIVNLTDKESPDSRIDGFSASYLSALLNAYFPNLLPILDRRLLINLKLVLEKNWDSKKQIKDIKSFYKQLILEIARIVRESGKSIREVDRQYFSIPIKH